MKLHKTKHPLSPHLSIYKVRWTMFMSISHRISGVLIYLCFPLLPFYLFLLGCDVDVHHIVMNSVCRYFALPVLFVLSWCLFYHMSGGVRYILLLMGYGHGERGQTFAMMVLPFSLLLSILFWFGA